MHIFADRIKAVFNPEYYKAIKALLIKHTFIFMHLADAFIQSDLQCISYHYVCSLGIEPTTFCTVNAMLTTEPQEDLHTLHTGTHILNISFTYLMSSSWAKMMTPRALGVSISLLMILSNSPGLGSRGIFMDWAMHRPPLSQRERDGHQCWIFSIYINDRHEFLAADGYKCMQLSLSCSSLELFEI